MAQERPDGPPYGAFNFRLRTDQIGNGDSTSYKAGFQEISGLSMEVTEAEYRRGNSRDNHVQKISGIHKVGDVTLKRGVIGAVDLYAWIKAVGGGEQAPQTNQTLTIEMLDETGNTPVLTWHLTGAKPKSFKGPTFNAKGGTDVAIEELVISAEGFEME